MKGYDFVDEFWEDFKNRRAAVYLRNREEAIQFLELVELDTDLRWQEGQRPTLYLPPDYPAVIRVNIRRDGMYHTPGKDRDAIDFSSLIDYWGTGSITVSEPDFLSVLRDTSFAENRRNKGNQSKKIKSGEIYG